MDSMAGTFRYCLPTGNNGNFAYRVAFKDIQLGAAMCRAYNNWCHDYCSVDPKRLKFVAVLPGSDVGEMVKEARRAVEELGAVSVRNPYLPDGKWLHEPEYDALWNLGLRAGLSHRRPWRDIANAASNPFANWKATERRHRARVARTEPCAGISLRQYDDARPLYLYRRVGALSEIAARLFSNRTRAGCPSGSAEWTITPTAATASWANRKTRTAADRIFHAPMHRLVRQRRARAQTCGRRIERREHRLEHRLPASRRHRTRNARCPISMRNRFRAKPNEKYSGTTR